MVKANGYGLGAVAVARALEQVDPWGYGVATATEGAALRAAGVTRPIVVFTPLVQQPLDQLVAHDLRPVIGDAAGLARWLEVGDRPFHLEIDTGMSRAGVRWTDRDELAAVLSRATASNGWEGLFTHFQSAEDPDSQAEQLARFERILEGLPRRPVLIHAANSAASFETASGYDLVRPGIFIYGGAVAGHQPEPVVKLLAPVVSLREVAEGESVSYGATWRASGTTRVATLGVGYADGVPRSLGNSGSAELAGRVCRMIGRITMDMTMVEAPDTVGLGDTAVVYGGLVTLDQQAAAAGTIAYDLLTSLGSRVPRHYQGQEDS